MNYTKFYETQVWKDAHQITLDIYQIAGKQFPKIEQFGLTSQICRSGSSMGANIAEGFEQLSHKMKLNYLNIAKNSCVETQNHWLLARDLKYITTDQCDVLMERCNEILKQLGGWIKKLK